MSKICVGVCLFACTTLMGDNPEWADVLPKLAVLQGRPELALDPSWKDRAEGLMSKPARNALLGNLHQRIMTWINQTNPAYAEQLEIHSKGDYMANRTWIEPGHPWVGFTSSPKDRRDSAFLAMLESRASVLPNDLTVWRAVNEDEAQVVVEHAIRNGGRLAAPFMPSTLSPDFATQLGDRIVFEIQVPAGTPVVVPGNPRFSHEMEVLLPPAHYRMDLARAFTFADGTAAWTVLPMRLVRAVKMHATRGDVYRGRTLDSAPLRPAPYFLRPWSAVRPPQTPPPAWGRGRRPGGTWELGRIGPGRALPERLPLYFMPVSEREADVLDYPPG